MHWLMFKQFKQKRCHVEGHDLPETLQTFLVLKNKEWKTCFSAGEQEDRDQRGGEAQRYVQRQEREREEKGVGVGRAGPGPRRIQQEARSCPWAALVVPCYSEVGSVFQSVSRDPPARPLRPLAVTLDEGFPHCSISGSGLCSSPRLSS